MTIAQRHSGSVDHQANGLRLAHTQIHALRQPANLAAARLRHRVVDQEISEHRAAEGPADERCHHCVSHCRAPLSPNQMCERVWTLPLGDAALESLPRSARAGKEGVHGEETSRCGRLARAASVGYANCTGWLQAAREVAEIACRCAIRRRDTRWRKYAAR